MILFRFTWCVQSAPPKVEFTVAREEDVDRETMEDPELPQDPTEAPAAVEAKDAASPSEVQPWRMYTLGAIA